MTQENVEFIRCLANAMGAERASVALDHLVTLVRENPEAQKLLLDKTVRMRLPKRKRDLDESRGELAIPDNDSEVQNPEEVEIALPKFKTRKGQVCGDQKSILDESWSYAVIEGDKEDQQVNSPKELTILLAKMVLQKNMKDKMNKSFWKSAEILRVHNKASPSGGVKTQTTEVAPGIFVYTSVARRRNLYNSRLLAGIIGIPVMLYYTYKDGDNEVTYSKEIQKTGFLDEELDQE